MTNLKLKNGLTVGVWMPLHPGLRLRGEGLFRYLSFVAGGLPEGVKFLTFVPPWLKKEFDEELQDLNTEVRGRFVVKHLYWEFSLVTILLAYLVDISKRANDPKRVLASYNKKVAGQNKKFISVRGKIGYFIKSWRLIIPLSVAVSVLSLAAGIFEAIHGRAALAVVGLAFMLITALIGARLAVKSLVKESKFEKDRLKKAAFFDIVARNIKKRYDMTLESLAVMVSDRDYNRLAKKLSIKGSMDCWYVVNASLRSARHLKGPMVSMFADFMFLSCPSNMPSRPLRRLKADVNRVLRKADQIICLSEHTKRDHLVPIAGARSLAKVTVIRVAPVNILEDAPYIVVDGTIPLKTDASLSAAKEVVRAYLRAQVEKDRLRKTFNLSGYVADRHLILQYLEGFLDADAPFVFCSTQNRAYKNVALIVQAVDELRKGAMPGLRLIMTGQIDYRSTGLPDLITELGAIYDFISLPRVPRPVHSALYHLAAVTAHPSFHEGGTGAFPLWESSSVGTPVVLSRNASTREEPNLESMDRYMFDPYSVDDAKEVLLRALTRPAEALNCVLEIADQKRSNQENWCAVGDKYYEVFKAAIECHSKRAD